ncbi:histidine phosphatase family protein [Liquorilactobacillus oeni]|uniref:Phosphoglycerate mutase n=1 Tax=Liquorilactobacillus oeni DSM 19972 TaxID=1423777 RepID=A0A0R1M7J7_9LACO|nr:histidine phosphatase family protein [Liquorilactobacillus oeni]KRL04151.1 phosphoglycerate mutase [Liquorilactobacillus oeni DSM 19972]
MVVHFYLVRHGQTKLNRLHRLQGITDSPLTKKGAAKAYKLGQRLSEIEFQAVYASDLKRAQTSAEIIVAENKKKKPQIYCEPDLRELSFGFYEEMKNRQMIPAVLKKAGPKKILKIIRGPKRVSKIVDMFRDTNDGIQVESAAELNERIVRILTQSGMKYENQEVNLLIVAHALILSIFIENLDKDFHFLFLRNTHLSKVNYKEGKFSIVERK